MEVMTMEEEDRPRDPMKSSVFDLTSPARRDTFSRPLALANAPKHLSIVELRLASIRLGVEVDDYTKTVCGIVIGMNPGPKSSWATPLFPSPNTSSAGRLLKMSKMKPGEYLGGLYRRNLVDDKEWSWSAGRRRARELLTALFDQSRRLRVILLGLKVAKCFNLPEDYWTPTRLESRQLAVVVPHPSGMNHLYNIEANRRLTGAWLRWAALGEEEP
jgi:hypothetical protein